MAELAPGTLDRLATVAAATVNMQLIKRGIRCTWIQGARPLFEGYGRVVGEAYTMRFIPMREDVATTESYAKARSMRDAIEEIPPGRIVVIDARGDQSCATLGDILAGRLKAKGTVGVVSDGPMRDVAGLREIGLPIFASGAAAPPSIAGLYFAGWEEPVGCGGVAVFPGDVVVADDDGPVVIPRALADEVARDAVEQERFEGWVLERIAEGQSVKGLYPPSEETQKAYEAWKAG